MKIVFVSNLFNHHQKFLSDELYKLCEKQFSFVALQQLTHELKTLGYTQYSDIPYLIYYDRDNVNQIQGLILDSDVVIIGSAPDFLIKNRLKSGKLVFRYSERPLKRGFEPHKYLYRFIRWHMQNKKKYNVYMLCASAYTASDYAKFGLFKNRCFKWGYFPETKRYDSINDLIENKQKNSILWVARFLDWKHPEIPIKLAKRLKDEGYDFTLKLIGVGPEKEKTEQLVKELNLDDKIVFLGSMSPENVRKHMEESEIFLFTSDRNEGWGAVLNESMNSACAVVANFAIGSAPYLIKDGENGFIYSGALDELYTKTKCLLDNPDIVKRFGLKAYETMIETWNADLAAERFLNLVDCINNKKEVPFKEGPCSMD